MDLGESHVPDHGPPNFAGSCGRPTRWRAWSGPPPTMTHAQPELTAMFAPPAVEVIHRADGATLIRSRYALEGTARCIGESLERWARDAPNRRFLMERPANGGDWQGVTYREALFEVRRV